MKDDNYTENAPCYLISYHRCKGHANYQLQHLERYIILNNNIFREIYSYQTSKEIHKHDNAQAFWNFHINYDKYFGFFSKWLVDLLLFVFLFPLIYTAGVQR